MLFTFKDIRHAVVDKMYLQIKKARRMKPGKGIYLNLFSRECSPNVFVFLHDYPLGGLS